MRAVELTDVFRIFGADTVKRAALQGLSLSVRDGEHVVVLGPSGSGKTTLLRLLAGLDRASAGSVRVFGLELGGLSRRELAAYRAGSTGYADQHYSRALAPELRAREQVALPLALRGASRAERHRRADELLERAGLAAKPRARPHELSGGEQQRIALCAAISHRPRLLLADEPTGELDHASAARIYDLLAEFARSERCTTVVVSHDPESAALADRVVQVRDGRVSGESARGDGADESIVVARGGWVRLPEELLRRTGIAARARASLENGGILVSPVGGAAAEPVRPPRESAAPAGGGDTGTRRVTKRFGRDAVLEGFDCSFAAGELTVVTGPSGSGKTTLLHLLAGLTLPDEGEVLVLGTDVAALGRAERADFRARHVGLVAQDAPLVPFLSAEENVELALALRRAGGSAVEALAAVGLERLRAQRTDRLSAGERERVAIARALAPRPAVLLADEPTARLDEANARAVGALLARWAHESGAAVVCATHDTVLVEQGDRELALAAAPAAEEQRLVSAN
jgi:ABC-type lipoprotein export system ATPase subunit